MTAEQTKAVTLAADPGPPSAAWTLLYQTTIQNFGNTGTEQNTISIYRLNDINRGELLHGVHGSAGEAELERQL